MVDKRYNTLLKRQRDPRPSSEQFGEVLKEYRLKRPGITQTFLSREIGFSSSFIALLEAQARSPPDLATVKKIAKALELNPLETKTLISAAQGMLDMNAGAVFLDLEDMGKELQNCSEVWTCESNPIEFHDKDFAYLIAETVAERGTDHFYWVPHSMANQYRNFYSLVQKQISDLGMSSKELGLHMQCMLCPSEILAIPYRLYNPLLESCEGRIGLNGSDGKVACMFPMSQEQAREIYSRLRLSYKMALSGENDTVQFTLLSSIL